MTGRTETRWLQRLENFERAFGHLSAACHKGSYTDLERAGLVQMFEFSFELAWKTGADLLSYEGYNVVSPRDVIRRAYEVGMVEDAELWLQALESRNRLTHTYDDATAREAEALIKNIYAPMIEKLLDSLRKRKPSIEQRR